MFSQFIGDCPRPRYIPGHGQCQCRDIPYIPTFRKRQRRRSQLASLSCIAEERFPQCSIGLVARCRLFLIRPFGESHRPTGKLAGVSKMSGVSSRIGLEGQQHVFHTRLAD